MKTKFTVKRRLNFLLCITLAQASLTGATCFASTTSILVQSGESGTLPPDGNGNFLTLGAPTINDFSHLVFGTRLFNTSEGLLDNSAIYRMAISNGPANSTPDAFELLAREGGSFSASGRTFELNSLSTNTGIILATRPATSTPIIGDFNNVALELPVIPGTGNAGNSILAFESSGSFKIVAEAKDQTPSGSGQYGNFSMHGFSANNELIFFSALDNTDNGVDDNVAIFKRYNDNSIVELVREVDAANGGILRSVGGINSNDFGQSVFSGLNDSDNDSANSGL